MKQNVPMYWKNPYTGDAHPYDCVTRNNALCAHLRKLGLDAVEDVMTRVGANIEDVGGNRYSLNSLTRDFVSYANRRGLLPALFYEIGWRDIGTMTSCLAHGIGLGYDFIMLSYRELRLTPSVSINSGNLVELAANLVLEAQTDPRKYVELVKSAFAHSPVAFYMPQVKTKTMDYFKLITFEIS